MDDFYLDFTGCRPLHGRPLQAAERMKCAVRAETGLTVAVAVALNKLLAKVASDLAKPDGLHRSPARMRGGVPAAAAGRAIARRRGRAPRRRCASSTW